MLQDTGCRLHVYETTSNLVQKTYLRLDIVFRKSSGLLVISIFSGNFFSWNSG